MNPTATAPDGVTFRTDILTDDTICYYNRFYPPEPVIQKALKDMKKGKLTSVLGLPERMQARAVKFLPVKMVMDTWCKQQKQPRE